MATEIPPHAIAELDQLNAVMMSDLDGLVDFVRQALSKWPPALVMMTLKRLILEESATADQLALALACLLVTRAAERRS